MFKKLVYTFRRKKANIDLKNQSKERFGLSLFCCVPAKIVCKIRLYRLLDLILSVVHMSGCNQEKNLITVGFVLDYLKNQHKICRRATQPAKLQKKQCEGVYFWLYGIAYWTPDSTKTPSSQCYFLAILPAGKLTISCWETQKSRGKSYILYLYLWCNEKYFSSVQFSRKCWCVLIKIFC